MRTALVCVLLLAPACQAFREFEVTPPSKVAQNMPPPVNAVGQSHKPYTGKPQYLAEARPLYPTTSAQQPERECAQRSQKCDDRLRATLASVDAQIVGLSSPPTDLQLQTLKLSLTELQALLAPYPDMMSERDEMATLVDQLPTQKPVEQPATKRRMTQLADLLRVQLAAAQ